MKTVPIKQAVEQTNVTQVVSYRGSSRLGPSLTPLQLKPQRGILSESAYTEAENYDCVPPKMRALINDHAISITTTNLV